MRRKSSFKTVLNPLDESETLPNVVSTHKEDVKPKCLFTFMAAGFAANDFELAMITGKIHFLRELVTCELPWLW